MKYAVHNQKANLIPSCLAPIGSLLRRALYRNHDIAAAGSLWTIRGKGHDIGFRVDPHVLEMERAQSLIRGQDNRNRPIAGLLFFEKHPLDEQSERIDIRALWNRDFR